MSLVRTGIALLIREELTIFLTCPTTRLQAIVTETERPFCVRPGGQSVSFFDDKVHATDKLPESVVGGAKRSGFCCSSGTLLGPMIGAPYDSLIG